MNVNASIDIGKNIAGLIEKLAQQIGTTTDKVFPWYVKQELIEGYSFFVLVAISFLISITGFFYSFKRANFEDENRYVPMTVVSAGFFLVTVIVIFLGSTTYISKILNPEMKAMQSMIADMSKLIK